MTHLSKHSLCVPDSVLDVIGKKKNKHKCGTFRFPRRSQLKEKSIIFMIITITHLLNTHFVTDTIRNLQILSFTLHNNPNKVDFKEVT